jgi:hypothetical protein
MRWTLSSAGNLRKIPTLKSITKICGRLRIIYLSNIAQIVKPMYLQNLVIVPIAAENCKI